MSDLKARYVDGQDNEILKEMTFVECGEDGFRHVTLDPLPELKFVNV